MKQVISRISQVRGIQSLHLATTPRATTTALAARTISTTATRSSETTEWLRKKLWKDGKAPGPADPYAPRIDKEYGMVEAVAPRAADDVDGTNNIDAHGPERLDLKLPLPPQRRREAATDKDIAETHPAYEPATSLDGLAEVPVLETWWEQPGNWGAADTFRGFGSVEKVTDKAAVQVYLRRALVEALALRQAGVLGEWAVRRWEEGSRIDMDAALAVDIVVREGKADAVGGEPVLEGNVAAVVDNLMREPLPEEEKGEEGEEEEADIVSSPPPPPPARISGSEAVEITKAWNAAWLNITVDEEMKFALRKRLYQLTGNLVPDAKLGAARTIRHLIALVAKKPKPQKLAEILNSNSSIAELANVKVHERRVGPIDKEIAVGRWKIIEEELRKRNLPLVMGSTKTANREKKYIKGKI